MEIRIGVQNAPREIAIDVAMEADEIEKLIIDATPSGVFSVRDLKGRRVVVPAANLAYVEISSATAGQVGFRS